MPGKVFNIAKNIKFYGYHCGLASMVYKFFDKKFTTQKGTGISSENQQVADELHRPVIRNLENVKYTPLLKTTLWSRLSFYAIDKLL